MNETRFSVQKKRFAVTSTQLLGHIFH